MKLCNECREAQWKWIESNPLTLFPSATFVSHAGYDDTVRGVRDNRTARYDKWRDLVDSQCRLIGDICNEQHQYLLEV